MIFDKKKGSKIGYFALSKEGEAPKQDTLGVIAQYFCQLYFSTKSKIFFHSIAFLCWFWAVIASVARRTRIYGRETFYRQNSEKKKGYT